MAQDLSSGDINDAGTAEVRLTPARFASGTTDTPSDGPNARLVSNVVVAGNGTLEGPPYSGMMYAWGQFIDHDLDKTDNDGVNHIDITVPDDDQTFVPGSTIPLTRAVVDPETGTQINAVTGWLDASMVYGSDAETAASLRDANGRLRVSDGDNLPIADGAFIAGDTRASENPDLTALQTLMVREHNHWADQLRSEHPEWSSDKIYDTARSIVTGEIQNITYSEFLPLLLGSKAPGEYHGFDKSVDPRITEEFAGSAFRFGHSIVSGEIAYFDNTGAESGNQSLGDAFFEPPATFEANGGASGLLRHLMGDISQKYDVHLVDPLRNLLFDPPAGQDLAAINIQRGRDLGFGSLNDTRAALGLKVYTSFDQITSDPAVAANLSEVYGGDVNKVELWIGGLAEDAAKGALVGPTFQTIIAKQFSALRDGDPNWFQNNDDLTEEEISQIKSTTLSDLIERNTDTTVAQANAFLFTERHASDEAPEHPGSPQLVIGVDDPNAVVAGGPMDDTIVAGLGLDQRLTGDGGHNTFVFLGSGHTDTITDFKPGIDTIDFESSESKEEPSLEIGTKQDSVVLDYAGNAITLAGVSPHDFKASDVVLNHHATHVRVSS